MLFIPVHNSGVIAENVFIELFLNKKISYSKLQYV